MSRTVQCVVLKREAPGLDVYARIEQIRAARKERFKGRRDRY